MKFTGRLKELLFLRNAFYSEQSELIVLLGRLGVGKTTLVNYFVEEYVENEKDSYFFSFEGNNSLNAQQQKKRFINKVQSVSSAKPEKDLERREWGIVFNWFKKSLLALPTEKKIFIFIDEFAWFNTKNSGFTEAFGMFWQEVVIRRNVLCVLSGSSVPWMSRNVIHAKGSLYHRTTRRILLKPFSYVEAIRYLEKKGRFSQAEKNQYYLVTGGVPRYLDRIQQGRSIEENLELVFNEFGTSKGEKEFDKLFSSTFNTSSLQIHKKIVMLFKDRSKIKKKEIVSTLSKNFSLGAIYNALEDLKVTGIVQEIKKLANERDNLCMLCDLFCFYNLKFFYKNNKVTIKNDELLKKYNGYAFEILAYLNVELIKEAIVREGMESTQYAFYNDKCQIDLLIDYGKDHYSLVECKYYEDKLRMTEELEQQLFNKRENLYKALLNRKNSSSLKVDIVLFSAEGVLQGNRTKLFIFDASLKNLSVS